MLDEAARLSRPYPAPLCQNRDCGADLDGNAYELLDAEEGGTVVFCEPCACSAVTFHPDRFKPVLPV